MSFSEWTKEKKAKEKAEAQKKTASSASVVFEPSDFKSNSFSDWTKKKKASTDFNAWANNIQDFSDRLAKDFTARQNKYNSAEDFDVYRNEINNELSDYKSQSKAYRDFFEKNKDKIGDKAYESALSYLDNYDKYFEAAGQDLNNEYDYWKQFSDEDNYNTNMRYKELSDSGKTADSIQYDLDTLQGKRNSLMSDYSNIMSKADSGELSKEEMSEASAKMKEAMALNDQIKQLEADKKVFKDIDYQTMLANGYRKATLKDLTINAIKQGYYNSLYGEASFGDMLDGTKNAEAYKQILEGEDYKFVPKGGFQEAVQGALNLVGQQVRQWTNPNSLAAGTAAAGVAALAGQAGPQIAIPEEVITVPGAFIMGVQAGSTASNFAIEAGFAYNEMIENGIPEDTAKKISLVVGAGNAALEFVQMDELVKSFKVVKNSGATKGVAKLLADELLKRGLDVMSETAQEVAQEAVTIGGAQAANKLETGEWDYDTEEVLERLGETAKSSALSFGLGNVISGGLHAAQIVNKAKNGESLTVSEISEINQAAGLDKETADEIAPAQIEVINETANVAPSEPLASPSVEQNIAQPTTYPSVDNIAENGDFEAPIVTATQTLDNMSKTLGENGAKALKASYDGSSDTAEFAGEFTKVYNASKNNSTIPETNSLSKEQIFAAKAAGENDRNLEVQKYGQREEVYLYEGSERNDGQNTVRQVSGMEETPGGNQSWKALSQSRDSEAVNLTFGGEVKLSSIVEGGSSEQSVRLVTGGATKATEKAVKIAKQEGLDIVLFASEDYLHIGDASDVQSYVDTKTKKAFIRVNDPDFTADQLLIHEKGHDLIAQGKVNIAEVRKNAIKATNGRVEQLATAYAEAYEGLTVDAVWEELICDSLARMNRFAGAARVIENAAARDMSVIRQATRYSEQQPRAPTEEEAMSRKGKFYNFPTYDISGSEANQIATRWARSSTTYDQDQKLISYHDKWYLIEKFDSNDWGYQIVEEVSKRNYNKVLEDIRNDNKRRYEATVRESVDNFSQFDRQTNQTTGRGQSPDNNAAGYRGEGEEVRGVDRSEPSRRNSQVNSSRDNAQVSSDKQNVANFPKEQNKFSRKGDFEQTKTMLAWHNMNAGALESALDLGGLAMPSFAVKPSDMAHSSYGDISIIARKESVAPNRNQSIYGGDAWTPTFPEVHYKVSYDKSSEMAGKVKALLEKAGAPYSQMDLHLDSSNISDKLNRTNESFVDTYEKEYGLKLAFLEDTGRSVTVPKKDSTYSVDTPALKVLAKKYGDIWLGENIMQYEPEIRKYLYDYTLNNYDNKMYRGRPFNEVMAESLYGEEIGFGKLYNILRDAHYIKKNGVNRVVDREKLNRRIDIAMRTKAVQNEYREWLRNLSEGVVEKRGIRNDKDTFTPSGSRRTFEQLHYDYSLANIVRAMQSEARQGRVQFMSGVGSLKGAALKSYDSIEDVRRDLDRIVSSETEESKLAYEEFNAHALDVAKYISPDDWLNGADMIADILSHSHTESGIKNYLNREYKFFEVQDHLDMDKIAHSIYVLGQEANTLPMEYFEAKLYRAFTFDEAAAVVVPSNTDKKLIERLEAQGANVLKYKAGDEADRLKKVNSVKDAKFSRKGNFDARYLEAVEKGDLATAQEMVDEAAEEEGYIARGQHGTTNIFTIFDKNKGNVEGDWGSGFYFSDSELDVATNYASNEGADLTNKIEHLADMLENEDEYSELSHSEIREIAKNRLSEGQPHTINAGLMIENPAVMGDGAGYDSTFLDYEENYDEENDEYDEPSGMLLDFIDAIKENASDYVYSSAQSSEMDAKLSEIIDRAYDDMGLPAADAAQMAKERLSEIELTDDEGNLVGNEVVRAAFEDLGFDAIIDNLVGYKFTNMKGVDRSTTHYIVFAPTQIKIVDPVTYDNEGNVIPLSERFNQGNKDIRYSRASESIETLRAENEELKAKLADYNNLEKRVAKAEGQLKRTEKPTLRKDDVAKLASQRINVYNADVNKAEINSKLQALGDFIVQDGENGVLDYNEVKDRAIDIARDLVENASELVNGDELQTYKKIRNYFKDGKFYFDNMRGFNESTPQYLKNDPNYRRGKGEIADYKYFHAKNLGRFTLTTDVNARAIDDAWAEAQDIFGYEYFPEDINNVTDMVLHISGLLDNMQAVYENPYDRDMAEVIEYEANSIIDSLIDESVRQTAPTYADKMTKKLEKQKYEDTKRTKELLAKVRQKSDEKIAALKQRYANMAAARRDRAVQKKSKERIISTSNRLLSELMRPNDKRHIPENLRGSVARVLEAINRESIRSYDENGKLVKNTDGTPTKRTQAFVELRKQLAEIKGELVIDPDLIGTDGVQGNLDAVIEMSNVPLDAMNTEQLQTVEATIRAVEAAVKTANKMFSSGRYETVSEAAERLKSDNDYKKAPQEFQYINRLQKLTGIDMMTPEAWFHRLGAYGDSLFRNYRNAQDKYINIVKASSEFSKKLLKDSSVKASEAEKTLHKVILGGKETQLSTAQLMELYNLYCRGDQAIEHILYGGGILPDAVSGKGLKRHTAAEPFRGITLDELSKAIGYLSADEIALADSMRHYLGEDMAQYGNEASMAVYNYKKFNEGKDYWPIKVNRQDVKTDPSADQNTRTSIPNKGFTKQTTPHANNSVKLGSAFDTFANHVAEMATYSAYLEVNEDLTRILNFNFRDENGVRTGTVKGLFDRVFGSGGSAYLSKLMSDVAMGVQAEKEYMGGFTANYKAAAVGQNLRVLIQQPTAILRALDMIDAKYLAAGVVPNNGWKKAVKYAPIAQWKDWGYFDINTGRQLKDILFDSPSKVAKLREISMAGASKMDSIAWGQLWNACELETKAKYKDLVAGSEEYYEHVAKRFSEIVDHTQVVDGILQRSQIMRSGSGLTKMATSFMGEPTKQYNMFMSAVYDFKSSKNSEKRKTATKRIGRTMFGLLVAGVVNAAAQSIVDALRDDDKEKKYWERWIEAFLGSEDEKGAKAIFKGNLRSQFNPASFVPYVKDMWSIIEGYDVTRMDMESVEKSISAVQNFTKSLAGEGKYTIAESSAVLFAETSRLFGIPVANLKRDVIGIANTIAVETDNFVMEYRMAKASLKMNYSYNSSAFYGILYNAYVKDKDAYEIIYKDMINSGEFTDEDIRKAMESRMKKAQGVTHAEDLEQRYLPPAQQKTYDEYLDEIVKSRIWNSADSETKDKAEDLLYEIVSGDSENGRKMQDKVEGGASAGLDTVEFILYKAALEMADKEGNDNNSISQEEAKKAIDSLGLSQSEKSYLWEITNKGWKSNPYKD